jgi:hypothetical protein
MKRLNLQNQGFVLPMLLSFIIAISIVISAVGMLLSANFQAANNSNQSQKAFNIAEAGVNYYLWHLNHAPSDYKDGQTTPATPDPALGYGPYVHNYIDDNAKKVGTFTLWIKPQGNGSTVSTIRSYGKVDGSNYIRTIESQIGAPSFASYSVASDGALWFGSTESANGPVHSNQGVRMDGASSDNVTSAKATYVAPANLGGNGTTSYPGVWCNNGITTPTNCATRSKVDWLYPTPQLDFNQITSSLCTIKKTAFTSDSSTSALAAGANPCNQVPTTRTPAYLPQRSTSFSATRGYLIELKPNGRYNLYNVNGEDDSKTPYTSALTLVSVANDIAIPSQGVIFAEDNVWVRSASTYSGRVTIGAGRLANTTNNADITIVDNLKYGVKTGADAVGLVAENNVTIAPYAPPASGSFTYEVDAAVIAQAGSVTYRGKFLTNSNLCTKGWKDPAQTFIFYGSVSTRQLWTWTWQWGGSCGSAINNSPDGYLSGILNNSTQYDYNLLYSPPPSFPLTSGFNVLQWHEVITRP